MADSEKKYIEVTTEDYEFALAGKVIHKSYKMITGVILVIILLLGFFGFKYNYDINRTKYELQSSKKQLDSLTLQYAFIADSLKHKVKELENEKKSADQYYKTISTSFGNSSKEIFKSFVQTTKENLTILSTIEDSMNTRLTKIELKSDDIETQVALNEKELKSQNEIIDQINKVDSTVKSEKKEIVKILNEFSAIDTEPKLVEYNSEEYSLLLGEMVGFKAGPENDKPKNRIISIGEDNYKFNEYPKFITKGKNTFSIKIYGDINDKHIIFEVQKAQPQPRGISQTETPNK